MNPADLQAIIEAIGIGALGVYTAWKAHRADRQTRSTGNGFAEEVKGALRRIETKIDDHLAAHANSDVMKRSE